MKTLTRIIALALLALAVSPSAAPAATPSGAVFYVATSGNLYAYQIGTWTQISHTTLPFTGNVRGTAFDVGRESLYIAYGGNGGTSGNGSLLRYNVLTGKVVWNLHFNRGSDMPAVCGGKIYSPSGSGTNNATWYILDADTGSQTGTLTGGSHPHNTICHNGHVYMGGEGTSYLYATGFPKIGPGPKLGVRPFTVNSADSRVYMTWTKYRGFSIGNTQTGKILKSISFGAIPSSSRIDAFSHGISIAPDSSEVYVIDQPAETIRVYGASDTLPHLADIKLVHPLTGQEAQCPSGSCTREGWLLHSLDGRYVFVGDAGDVINTATRKIVATLPALQNSRHGFVEVDWSGGVPVATSTHFGVGQ